MHALAQLPEDAGKREQRDELEEGHRSGHAGPGYLEPPAQLSRRGNGTARHVYAGRFGSASRPVRSLFAKATKSSTSRAGRASSSPIANRSRCFASPTNAVRAPTALPASTSSGRSPRTQAARGLAPNAMHAARSIAGVAFED